MVVETKKKKHSGTKTTCFFIYRTNFNFNNYYSVYKVLLRFFYIFQSKHNTKLN